MQMKFSRQVTPLSHPYFTITKQKDRNNTYGCKYMEINYIKLHYSGRHL